MRVLFCLFRSQCSSLCLNSARACGVTDHRYTKTNWAKKYGCRLARFTHTRTSVLHTSHRIDCKCLRKTDFFLSALIASVSFADTIRYLDLQKSSYIRYFEGHTAPYAALTSCLRDDWCRDLTVVH